MKIKDLKQYFYKGRAIKYAFPGLYPVFYLTADGETLCADCVTRNRKDVFRATHSSLNDGWIIAGVGINYEDNSMYCAECNKKIESAYGEDNADN